MSRSTFWSRRQAAVVAEAKAEEQANAAAQAAARDAELAEKSDDEILAELDLPVPESLSEGDDFKVFLTDQIPARIKTRALRHLWRANPVLACVDGLVDYGEDFTDAARVIEGLQSAYQVGKGMTKHVEALAQEAEAERIAAGEATPEAVPGSAPARETAEASSAEAPVENLTETTKPEGAQVAVQAGHRPNAEQPPAPQITAAPRRMRFSFQEGTA
jgi:hypothetical protein